MLGAHTLPPPEFMKTVMGSELFCLLRYSSWAHTAAASLSSIFPLRTMNRSRSKCEYTISLSDFTLSPFGDLLVLLVLPFWVLLDATSSASADATFGIGVLCSCAATASATAGAHKALTTFLKNIVIIRVVKVLTLVAYLLTILCTAMSIITATWKKLSATQEARCFQNSCSC